MAKKTPASPVPMSEDQRRFQPDWTPQDCIDELRRIAAIDETKVITRNFFRVNSTISESTWNRYFGTFHEFKRQAGIVLSRHAHRLELSIAKHASKDNQRAMMVDKLGWEGAYTRPHDKRFQSAVIGSDIHDIHCDPFYRRLFIETIERVQPEKVVIGGDLFDLTEFGRFTQDPREYQPLKRIAWVRAFLRDIRAAAPEAEITIVEGNHEFRLIRHLTEATPAMVTILSDLHGMTIPKLLGLTEFGVNYVARMDLAAFHEKDIRDEMKKNYVILWDALLVHHFPEGRNMGYPGVNGHHHKHLVWSAHSPHFGSFEWHQLGSGHRREAHYCAAEKWANGFMIAHVDTHTKRTQFEYVDCTADHTVIGGRWYERGGAEIAPV